MSEIRSGQIAIIGRPNVGKSTLLNALIGEKLSIVSRRAQTTRHRIMGILTRTDTQYLFVDTPGFQTRYGNALNQVMNRGVRQALAEVDVVLFVVEAGRFDERDRAVRQLVPADCPLIIVVNKIDQLKDKARLLPFLADLAQRRGFCGHRAGQRHARCAAR
jgi:GTP-binding protein Era